MRIEELLKPRRLVIFRLSKGELSEAIAALLGSLVITQLWFAAISRKERFPVVLIVDEIQTFSHLETIGSIVSEGRKYGLVLIAAHQHLRQLPEKTAQRSSGKCGNKDCFQGFR